MGHDYAIEHAMRASGRSRAQEVREYEDLHPDAVVAAVAGRQHGLIGREALLAAGLTRTAIAHRVKTGRLHPRYPGVHSLAQGPLPPLAQDLAAVLACGPGAVLSSLNAAVL